MAKKFSDRVIYYLNQQGIVVDDDDITNIKKEVDNPLIPNFLLPMIRTCTPEDCEHKSICPLIKTGNAPDGIKCPIDLATVENMYAEFRMYLDEIDASNDFAVELLIKDVIYNQLTLSRMEAIISDEGYFMEIPVPLSKDGSQVEYISETSKAYDIRERIVESTAKLYRLLGIDRYNKVRIDKLKLETKREENENNKYLNQVENLHDAMQLLSGTKIIDAEVIEEDTSSKTTKRSTAKKKPKPDKSGNNNSKKKSKPRNKKGGS